MANNIPRRCQWCGSHDSITLCKPMRVQCRPTWLCCTCASKERLAELTTRDQPEIAALDGKQPEIQPKSELNPPFPSDTCPKCGCGDFAYCSGGGGPKWTCIACNELAQRMKPRKQSELPPLPEGTQEMPTEAPQKLSINSARQEVVNAAVRHEGKHLLAGSTARGCEICTTVRALYQAWRDVGFNC